MDALAGTLFLPSAAAPDVNGKVPTFDHFLGDTQGRSGMVRAVWPRSLLGAAEAHPANVALNAPLCS